MPAMHSSSLCLESYLVLNIDPCCCSGREKILFSTPWLVDFFYNVARIVTNKHVVSPVCIHYFHVIKVTVYVPIFSVNSLSTGSRVSNLLYTGFGKSHTNLWLNPFSAFPGNSIKFLATLGWLKPPTTKLVVAMVKLASPVTIMCNEKWFY